MGARYSDRFFGPDGVAGTPPTPAAETIDLVEGVDIGAPQDSEPPERLESPERTRPWHANVAARAALAVALLAGGGAGAYGWDRWRDHQTNAVARSTVDLSSSASVENTSPDMNQLTLTVRVRNDGPHAVTVTDVDPLDARLSWVGEQWRPLGLAPGEDVVRFLSFAIDCGQELGPDDGSDDAGSVLLARLRTIDGQQHETQLGSMGIDYYAGSLSQLLTDQCTFQAQRASYSSLYAEVGLVQMEGDLAVTSTILLNDPYTGSPAQSAVTLNATPDGAAFATAVTPRASGATGPLNGVDLRWTVKDCAAAMDATESDMTVLLGGSMPSEAGLTTVTVWPSPTLAAGLARLSERVCG